MSYDKTELCNIVEAAVFTADEPVTIANLVALFPEDAAPTRAELDEALALLGENCHGRGIELKRVGKGYRFQSREKYSQWLRKLYQGRPPRYSRAALETLAIIAYRQPVTRGDIEEIRGVSVSGETVRSLMNRGWIKEVGHRDVAGRPALLGTTREFLEYFNLRTLSELPPLLEKRDLCEIAGELNLSLPIEEPSDDAAAVETQPDGPPSAQIIPLDLQAGTQQTVDGETA